MLLIAEVFIGYQSPFRRFYLSHRVKTEYDRNLSNDSRLKQLPISYMGLHQSLYTGSRSVNRVDINCQMKSTFFQ